MFEALVVLEVASVAKVSDLDLWVLSFFVKEDVLVLDVTVYNLLHVYVL